MQTVLVVDADPKFRKAVCTALGEHRFHAVGAGGYRDGIAALEKGPSCIVLSARLPDGYGVEVLREARRRGMHVEGVVLTEDGSGLDGLLELAPLQPDHTFFKPVDPQSIVDWIERGAPPEVPPA